LYLKLMTWPEPGIDESCIRGSQSDFFRLAEMIERVLAGTPLGHSTRIDREYAADTPYSIVLDVRADDFDPSSADPELTVTG
jgi:hypothetical protein